MPDVVSEKKQKRKIRKTENSFYIPPNEAGLPEQLTVNTVVAIRSNPPRKGKNRRPLRLMQIETSDSSDENSDDKISQSIKKSTVKVQKLPKIHLMDFVSTDQKSKLKNGKESTKRPVVETRQNSRCKQYQVSSKNVGKREMIEDINTIEVIEDSGVDVIGDNNIGNSTDGNRSTLPCETNNKLATDMEKRTQRKRWTICEGTEAKKSFELQLEKIAEICPPSPEQYTRPKRLSTRKRWSDEMKRKSFSFTDLSINAIPDVLIEEDSANESEMGAFSKSTRRSKSHESSIRKSGKKYISTPHLRRFKSPKRIYDDTKNSEESVMQNADSIHVPSIINSSKPSSSNRLSKSHESPVRENEKKYRTTPHVKSFKSQKPIYENLNNSEKSTEVVREEDSINGDSNINPSKPSTSKRHSLAPCQSSKKRRTYELDEPQSDIELLRSLHDSHLSLSGFDVLHKKQQTDSLVASNINPSKPHTSKRRSKSHESAISKSGNKSVSTPHVRRFKSQKVIYDDFNTSDGYTEATKEEDSFNVASHINRPKPSTLKRRSMSHESPIRNSRKKHRPTPHITSFKSQKGIHEDLNNSEESIDEVEKGNSISAAANINSSKPSTSKRHSLAPCESSKKRRTYELDEPQSDIELLRSLHDSQLSLSGVDVLPEEQHSLVDEKVRFVTMRKPLRRGVTITSPYHSVTAQSPGTRATASTSSDRTLFSPSFVSSTPLVVEKKRTMLKQVLVNETKNSVGRNKRRSQSAEDYRSINRIKMPNFAKIHQRALDRVEDVREMTERKAERARLLLSGQRPKESSAFKSTGTHRQLAYNDTNQPSPSSEPNTKHSETLKGNVDKKLGKENGYVSQKVEVTRMPPIAGCSKVLVPNAPKISRKAAGIKHTVQKKEEELKADMSAAVVKGREKKRTVIKGIRTNRRFELLMEMRKKK